jgi:hypothetical protein
MFGRRRRDGAVEHVAGNPAAGAAIGIGALVFIASAPGSADEWDGEPTGVVIAPGDNEIVGYPGLNLGSPRHWLIAFDEPAYMKDGRGPFEQASVAARLLVPLAAIDDGAGS